MANTCGWLFCTIEKQDKEIRLTSCWMQANQQSFINFSLAKTNEAFSQK